MALSFKVTALTDKGIVMIANILQEKLGIKGRMAISLNLVDEKTLIYTVKMMPNKPELYSVVLHGGYGQPSLATRFEREYSVKANKDFKIERYRDG